jgi:hypothetical protein
MKLTQILLFALLVGVLLIAAKLYLVKPMQTVSEVAPTETQAPLEEEPMTFASPTTAPGTQNGTIEGSLSYPSEGIPDAMIVCAESNELEDPICTSAKITDKKYTYGKGYTLQVPPGTYLVYAKLPDQEYRAYYNVFVTCGLLASCTNHTPIEVIVTANTTVKADPQDWYNMQPSL